MFRYINSDVHSKHASKSSRFLILYTITVCPLNYFIKKKKGWTLHDFGLTVSKRNIF